jgi:hypothetical protein
MPEHVIADSDIWLILDVLDRLPADEAQLRIREAIAYGRRILQTPGVPVRRISLEAVDVAELSTHLGRARQRFSLAEQRALDRIVRQLRIIS